MPQVVFPDCTPYMAQFFDKATLATIPELELRIAKPSPNALLEAVREATAIIHFQTRLTGPILAACPHLRVIVFLGTGVSSWVDLPAAEHHGIVVRRVLGYADRTVAEHTLALILACARRLLAMDRKIRNGVWHADALFELAGKTLGIVGIGGIGRELARIGSALGLRVIGWNRSPVPANLPCELRELDDLFRSADIVSIHLALSDQTRGFVDRRRLALMKPGAIFLNTARGALVDQLALSEFLREERIAAAGLDVFAEEPLPRGHPLTRLDNVVLSAHAAWMSPEAARRLVCLGLTALREELARLTDT
jgi:D-3-phosphoglycerate dehydrogenase